MSTNRKDLPRRRRAAADKLITVVAFTVGGSAYSASLAKLITDGWVVQGATRENARLGRVVKELHEQLDEMALSERLTGPVVNLNPLAKRVAAFAERYFPLSTVESCATKLVNEATELVQDPHDVREAADVLIVLMTWLKQASLTPQNLVDAAEEKMQINETRKWECSPDGTYQHVQECCGFCLEPIADHSPCELVSCRADEDARTPFSGY